MLDLITTYPRRYIDRTNQAAIGDLAEGEEAMIVATVRRVQSRRTRQGRTMVEVDVSDGVELPARARSSTSRGGPSS